MYKENQVLRSVSVLVAESHLFFFSFLFQNGRLLGLETKS